MSIFDSKPVRDLKAAEKAPSLYGVYTFQQKIHDFLTSSPADTKTNEYLAHNAMNRLAHSGLISPLAFMGFSADMIKTYNCTNNISKALENHLTVAAGDLNTAMPSQKPAFAALYSYFSEATSPAQASFATCAAGFLSDQHPDQGMTPAFEMYNLIKDKTAAKGHVLKYITSYSRDAVNSQGMGATIDLLMTSSETAPDSFLVWKAREAVADIIARDPNGVMDADRPADWPIKAALWSMQSPAQTQSHYQVIETLTKAWLPAYGEAHGIDAVAPYFETLMRAHSEKSIREEITAYMLPRLDVLAAVQNDITPAIKWARMIGADHPGVMEFSARHLPSLLMRPTNDFDELAKPLPKETLAAIEPLLPQDQRVRLQNFLTPPQPYQRCGVHIVE